jgi:predicted metalloenzyme YecM
MDNVLLAYVSFLDNLFSHIANSGIGVDTFILDHLAYRPITTKNYEQLKLALGNMGTMLSEIENSGRNISIFKLKAPFLYRHFEIPFFELLGPKPINTYPEGYQHVEFVIDCGLKEFMATYPKIDFNTAHLTDEINPSIALAFEDTTGVEFHIRDIGEVVSLQQDQLLHRKFT